MGSWVVTAIVKAVLEWLTSLWVRLQQKYQNIEQGREEVREQVRKETEKVENEWKNIDRTDISVDTAINRLRERSDSHYKVPGPGSTNTTGSGST
jgi:hypothetical protein